MRNTLLLSLGGALLATTSLTATAQAATVNAYSAALTATGVKPTGGFTSAKIGAQLFGGSGFSATTTLGAQFVFVNFSNTYTQGLAPKIILIPTGATFSSTSLNSSAATGITLINSSGQTGATITNTVFGVNSGCAVGVLTTQIQITNCMTGVSSSSITGVGLSGLVYAGATGLVTAGATIALSGAIVEQANSSNTFEAITSANVVQSQNMVIITNSSATATVNLGTGATSYTTVTQTVAGNASAGLTVVLTQIAFTGTGAVYADLLTTGAATNLVGNLGITVTSTALSDPAIANVRFLTSSANFTNTTLAGTATFSSTNLTGITLDAGAGSATNIIQIEYNGTTSITGAAAGTTAGTFLTNTANNGTALPVIAATASAVSRVGFTVQVNSVQASTNTAVTSYIRITNGGTVAGIPIITVYNASTGAAMGTYTVASVPGLATLTLTAKDIETAAGVTPILGTSYDLVITGTLPNGYVQHINGNPGNLFVDFSARRNSALGVNQ